MNRSNIVIAAPALLGIMLIPLVFLNLSQFDSGSLSVQAMLSREIPVVMLGFISCIAVFFAAIIWLFKRQWLKALYSIVSIFVFFISFIITGINGAAFLNAT